MTVVRFGRTFTKVPAGSQLKTFVELTSGHLESVVMVADSDPATPNLEWLNSTVLRTAANPNAEGQAPIVGPAGCVLLANLAIMQNNTTGKMVVRVVDASDNDIRDPATFAFTALKKKDAVNGIVMVRLA